MKAWEVESDPDRGSTVVFAETRGQAKQVAMNTQACEDVPFIEISCRRMPDADKLYKGEPELQWSDDEARIFLVKEHGWGCIDPIPELCNARCCSAWEWCHLGKEAQEYE